MTKINSFMIETKLIALNIFTRPIPFSLVCVSVSFCLLLAGCKPPRAAKSNSGDNGDKEAAQNEEDQSTRLPPGTTIVSDGPITIENGKVTYGEPELTEQKEKEIYKALQHRLNMAEQIEKQNPGGNAASRSMRDEYRLIKQGFMNRYKLNESDIARIIKKGKAEGWK